MATRRILSAVALFALPLILVLPRTGSVSAQTSGALAATLNASPSTVAAGQNVQIAYGTPPTAASSSTPGLTTSSIDFGDGITADGGSVGPGQAIIGNLSHAYSDPGSYTITFTAQSPDGVTASASVTVTVVSQLQTPSVQLRGPASAVQPGDSASFTYSVTPATGADITGMTIAYGDGATDQLSALSGTATHVYTDAGSYVVLLTVVDSNGQVGAASAQVQVGSP